MRPAPVGSLGGRLSRWLAIQTFIGLAFVSLAVYFVTAMHLASSQAEALAEKQNLVIHLLKETRGNGDLPELTHKLDDFIAGHADLSLTLVGADGSILYRTPGEQEVSQRVRSTQLSLVLPAAALGKVTARLFLNTDADDALLRRLATALAGAALLGSMVVSLGGFLLVRLGLKPVQHLVDQTRDLAADTLSNRLDGSAQPQELQPLVEQFNGLLDRLERSYEQLEGFNANVAHELNTPLATLITSTELALRRERDAEALRELLGSQLEELHRVSGVIKDMLFLSRAERGGRARRNHVPSLAAVATDVAEYHEAALADAALGVEVAGDAAGEFDVQLLKRAISNLLGNATRFADRGSTVRIEIAQQGPNLASLAIVNYGPAIAADHLPRLFDRFFRADPSRSHADLHHGLGLAIVAAIARMHDGQPFATSAKGLTTIGFTIRSGAAARTPGSISSEKARRALRQEP